MGLILDSSVVIAALKRSSSFETSEQIFLRAGRETASD
jgi:hypothetical protein